MHILIKERKWGEDGVFVSNSFMEVKMEATVSMESFEHMQISFVLGGYKFMVVVV